MGGKGRIEVWGGAPYAISIVGDIEKGAKLRSFSWKSLPTIYGRCCMARVLEPFSCWHSRRLSLNSIEYQRRVCLRK
jgi:hypothetical protein